MDTTHTPRTYTEAALWVAVHVGVIGGFALCVAVAWLAGVRL